MGSVTSPGTAARSRRSSPGRWMGSLVSLLLCVLLSGCTMGGTVDSLLQPPQLSQEQQQIYLALQDAVGSGITLQYPRSGSNLSAFTVVDLDHDGDDEALVFYKKTSLVAAENSLRLSVLDQEHNSWQSVCDCPAEGTDVDRIVISPLGDSDRNQIFVGYSGVDQSDKALNVYEYCDGSLDEILTASYSMFDVEDLDGDGLEELLVLEKATESAAASAAMYRWIGKSATHTGKLELRTGFTEFSQVLCGRLSDSTTGIYIDGTSSPTSLQTEVIRAQGNSLQYVLADAETVSQTLRSVGYLSMDLGSNGTVEIPVLEPFPGYSAESSDQIRMTRWLEVSGDSLREQSRGYMSVSDGVIFLLPVSWYGTVTAVTDVLTGDIVFCRYDGEIREGMTALLRCGVAQDEETQEERESDGYLLLRTKGKAAFYMRAEGSEDPLSMTWQELMVHFRFV